MKQKRTRKQLRVAVARDVLRSLEELRVTTGRFLGEGGSVRENETGDSRKTAKRLKRECKVCALGACFLSVVSLDDLFDFAAVDNGFEIVIPSHAPHRMLSRLRKAFSPVQLMLIEQAFERGKGFFNRAADDSAPYDYIRLSSGLTLEQAKAAQPLRELAIDFGMAKGRGLDDKKRLGDIMRNIIRNEGTFRP